MKKSYRRSVPLLRTAVHHDAKRVHDLIQQNQQAGHLLPRQLGELIAHIAPRPSTPNAPPASATGSAPSWSRSAAKAREPG